MSSKLKVLMVAAEVSPLAKVGGLADVIGSLPKALIDAGEDVRLVIPKYGLIDEKKYKLEKIAENLKVPFAGGLEAFNLYLTALPNSQVLIYLIDHPKYLGQNGVYVSPDASSDGSVTEAQRFIFFTRAVLEIFPAIGWTPDLLHCHDWHVGLLPALVKLLNRQIPTLLTIHNLAYQGNYDADLVLNLLNSPTVDLTTLPTIKNRLDNSDTINCLEQGILNADLINTVSPAYSQEILTPEFGCGLDKILKKRQVHLYGILNGIDTDFFDPERDQHLVQQYSVNNLEQKLKNKDSLQKECGFKVDPEIPLIGLVSRLTEQKGFDLLLPIMKKILKLKLQLVLLAMGDKKYETEFANLSKKTNNFYAALYFDPALAQRIYAGSDLFLMPSRFEPCGLGQMIAMRYGTLPIVRSIGGLKDTVTDLEQDEGTGFVFNNYTSGELLSTINRAINFYNDKVRWAAAQKRAMLKNFSWPASAKKYLNLYDKLLNKVERFNI